MNKLVRKYIESMRTKVATIKYNKNTVLRDK